MLPPDVVREGLAELALPASLENLMKPRPSSDWAKMAVLEASQYMRNQLLRDADWASMAHSLEVRVPLVDHVLLGQLAPTIARARRVEGKRWLAMSPAHALPHFVRNRAKTGFSTPVESWLSRAEMLDAWRGVPALAHPSCPWARRFAYAIARRLG
jgi:asparagine synthase (glutamine-hydrolysing)